MFKKKILIGLICLAQVFIWGVGIGFSAWVNIGVKGGGGWYRCVEFSPFENKLFIGGDVSGLFMSQDLGESFTIQNNIPTMSYVQAIYFHPNNKNIIYLGTRSGIVKSIDGGQTWTLKRNGFSPMTATSPEQAAVYAIAIDKNNPDVLYAGLGYERKFGKDHQTKVKLGYFYISRNGADSWAEIKLPEKVSNESIMSIIIDPIDNGKIYLLTESSLLISTDSGKTWIINNTLPYGGRVYSSLAIKKDNPKILLISYAEQNRTTGVLKSQDNGQTWKNVIEFSEKSEARGFLRIKNMNNVFYAIYHRSYSHGTYISKDEGETWARINNPAPKDKKFWFGWSIRTTDFAVDPKNSNIMCYVNDMEAYLSKNDGKTWECITSKKISGSKNNKPIVWKGSGADILCSTDLAIDPRDPRILYFSYMDTLLWKSIDGGQTCFQITDGLKYRFGKCCRKIEIDPDRPDTLYISVGQNRSKMGIYKSSNSGKNFALVGSPKTGLSDVGIIQALAIDPASNPAKRILYAGIKIFNKTKCIPGMYKSTDGGNTWGSINKGLPQKRLSISSIVVDSKNPDTIYIGASYDKRFGWNMGYIAKSENGGETWEIILDNKRIESLSIDPFNSNILYAGACGKVDKEPRVFWKSTDKGKNWESLHYEPFNIGKNKDFGLRYETTSIVCDPKIKGRLYITLKGGGWIDGSKGRGILVSNDHGETWDDFDTTGLPNLEINKIVIDPHKPSRLYALTSGNGIWRYGPKPQGIPKTIINYYSVKQQN